MKYRPEIDGLRTLAVLSVMLYHAGFSYLNAGFLGVDVFFVISGFLITSLILNDLSRGRFSILEFYDRRVRRIMPALFLVVTVTFAAGFLILLPADLERFSLSVIAATTFWSNILFWSESGYFDTAAELKPLLHTWSLAVEEQYYIFFPPLLALLWRFGLRAVAAALLILAVASLAWGLRREGFLADPDSAFYLLPTRIWQLLVGALAAIAYRSMADLLPTILAGLFSFTGFLLVSWALVFGDTETFFPDLKAMAVTFGTATIILFERKGTLTYRMLANPVAVAVGLISYSAYLWHQPLFVYARYLSDDEPEPWVMWILMLCTLGLAYLTYRFVETPFRDRARLTRRQVFKGMFSAGVAVLALGAIGLFTKGGEFRYTETQLAVFRQFVDPGNYVRTRFNNLVLAEFDANSEKRKLLIVGDSYGQDVVNAVYENEQLSRTFQISTFRISSRCGNIFVERSLDEFIAERDKKTCARRSGYENEDLRKRMQQADEIWLASSWLEWQVALLPETLMNIEAHSTAKVRIFGRKNFGAGMSLKRYQREINAGNASMELAMRSSHLATNEEMRRIVPPEAFVDVSEIMCGPGPSCINSTEAGLLISYDSGHLTKAGATLMGERLSKALH